MKKCLKRINVSEDIFEKILSTYDAHIKEVDKATFESKECGYRNAGIKYRYKNQLICELSALQYVTQKEILSYDDYWKQVIIMVDSDIGINSIVTNAVTGPQAKTYMTKVLKKNYTVGEINDILHQHEAEYDAKLKQQHYQYVIANKIIKFEDCYYYDINNAHGSALLEMFSKSANDILKMYKNRKERDGYFKKIFNYYVGMLGKKDGEYRKTYNWIVQRTTKMLMQLMHELDGLPVYINTDGIMLNNVKNIRESSAVMGEFKREHGTIYTYQADNYWVLQFIDDNGDITTKGNLPLILRDKIDLASGKVVSYKRLKVSNHYEYQDVREVYLNEKNTKSKK